MIRKVFFHTILLIYLIAASGLTVQVHFCHHALHSISADISHEMSCCCHDCDNQCNDCSNVVLDVKINDYHHNPNTLNVQPKLVECIEIVLSHLLEENYFPVAAPISSDYSPPPLIIQHRTLLI